MKQIRGKLNALTFIFNNIKKENFFIVSVGNESFTFYKDGTWTRIISKLGTILKK